MNREYIFPPLDRRPADLPWIPPDEPDERTDRDWTTCALCDADLAASASGPLCTECRDGYALLGGGSGGGGSGEWGTGRSGGIPEASAAQRWVGRRGAEDEGAIVRRGTWENAVRGMEDGE